MPINVSGFYTLFIIYYGKISDFPTFPTVLHIFVYFLVKYVGWYTLNFVRNFKNWRPKRTKGTHAAYNIIFMFCIGRVVQVCAGATHVTCAWKMNFGRSWTNGNYCIQYSIVCTTDNNRLSWVRSGRDVSRIPRGLSTFSSHVFRRRSRDRPHPCSTTLREICDGPAVRSCWRWFKSNYS